MGFLGRWSTSLLGRCCWGRGTSRWGSRGRTRGGRRWLRRLRLGKWLKRLWLLGRRRYRRLLGGRCGVLLVELRVKKLWRPGSENPDPGHPRGVVVGVGFLRCSVGRGRRCVCDRCRWRGRGLCGSGCRRRRRGWLGCGRGRRRLAGRSNGWVVRLVWLLLGLRGRVRGCCRRGGGCRLGRREPDAVAGDHHQHGNYLRDDRAE